MTEYEKMQRGEVYLATDPSLLRELHACQDKCWEYNRLCPTDARRRNEMIRAREVRVIAADGEQLGILQRNEAIALAKEAGMDLVEVSSNSEPPVCRVMDYGKFKYEQQKKKQEAKKNQTVVQIKEIKVRPKTDDHDYETKVRHIRRFLDESTHYRPVRKTG